MIRWILAFALSLMVGPAWAGGPQYPPPPQPSADCTAGQAITGYPSPGSPLGSGGHCGIPVASGTVNVSTVGQPAVYTGTGTVTGFTPGGDVTFASPNFTVGALKGVALGSTTATAGNLMIGSGTQWITQPISGDATLSSAGALTLTSIGGKAVSLANSFSTAGNFGLTLTQTGATNVTLPTSGTLATQAYVTAQGFTLGSTPITVNGAAYTTIAGLTLTSPTLNTPTIAAPTITNYLPKSAPLLGSDNNGNPVTVSLGTNLSLGQGNVLNATGGGGSFTPPASGTLMVSNGTPAPNGLTALNNALLVGSGGAWTTLGSAASSVLITDTLSVPQYSKSLPSGLTIPGYLTGNQPITIGGDCSGSGATAITETCLKVNGVNYPSSPATSTIPVVTGTNQITYDTAAQVLSVLGTPFSVPNGGSGLAIQTSGAIYKGNGTSNIAVSALSDNGTIVSTTEPIDLTTNSAVIEVANAGTGGTTAGLLAKLSGAPSTALTTLTSDTDGAVGIVIGGGGTTGSAQIAVHGRASCTFDGATTAGHFVTISGTVAGNCHDFGAARPTGAQSIGQVLSTNGAGGSFQVEISVGFSNAAGSAPTWPTTGSIVVSNATNTPAGIAPVNGDCIVAAAGAWGAGTCLSGGGVTSSGTSTVNNIPFWTGTGTLSNTGVPYGTTGNGTLVETTAGGVITNSLISALPLGNLATIADATVLSNVSGGAAIPSANTLTSIIDHDIGSTRGAILERGASTWTAIAPGTTGYVWTSNGAAADPTWQVLPSVGISGMTSGQLAVAGSASTVTSSIAYSNVSAANTIAEMGAGGLLSPGMLPLATSSAFGAVKVDGTSITAAGGVISAGVTSTDTVTTNIAAAGTTQGSAASAPSQQNYVATGANCAPSTYQGGAGNCSGSAGVVIASALMVAGNHIYVTNEDPTNALLVYPNGTNTINNQAASAFIQVAPNSTAHLNVKSTTALRTVP